MTIYYCWWKANYFKIQSFVYWFNRSCTFNQANNFCTERHFHLVSCEVLCFYLLLRARHEKGVLGDIVWHFMVESYLNVFKYWKDVFCIICTVEVFFPKYQEQSQHGKFLPWYIEKWVQKNKYKYNCSRFETATPTIRLLVHSTNKNNCDSSTRVDKYVYRSWANGTVVSPIDSKLILYRSRDIPGIANMIKR